MPEGPRLLRVPEREDGLDVARVEPVRPLFQLPARDPRETVQRQEVGARSRAPVDGKDDGDAAPDGPASVEDRLFADKQLFLVVDPPGDDGAAVEVDGAGRVVAPVQDDHGDGRGAGHRIPRRFRPKPDGDGATRLDARTKRGQRGHFTLF